MKQTLAEVRASLEGYTVSMLRDIVHKDSTIKGVSRMRKAELIEAAATVVAKLNPEVVEAESVEEKAEITESSPERHTEKRVYDFRNCKEEKVLRKALSSIGAEALKGIASSYAEIQLETWKKRPTKAELIDAIVRIYFPNAEVETKEEPIAPVERAEVPAYWKARLLSNLPKYKGKEITSANLWKVTVEYSMAMLYACHSAEDVRICLEATPVRVLNEMANGKSLGRDVKNHGGNKSRAIEILVPEVWERIESDHKNEKGIVIEKLHKLDATYKPEFWEETYSDYAGDNSHGDDDTDIDSGNSGTQSDASEHVLGRIRFKYKERKEEKTLECVVKSVPQTYAGNGGENHIRCAGATVWEIRDREGQLVAGYSPMLDILQFSVMSDISDLRIQDKVEKQFREQLPEMLCKAGLLDAKGELISDGNEEFRVLFYKAWCIDETVKRGEDFKMPSGPFAQGNDPEDPLTWEASVKRTKALRLFFKKMYYEQEKRLSGCSKAIVHLYSKRIEELRAELRKLYEEQAA